MPQSDSGFPFEAAVIWRTTFAVKETRNKGIIVRRLLPIILRHRVSAPLLKGGG